MYFFFFFFFFSSRRRHTRSLCDWSSDVCSSDLQSGSSFSRSQRWCMQVFRLTLGTLALCCVGVATVRAQDPVKVAPNNFTVLLENDQVRVLDFHSKGEKIPMHSHPKYLTYDIAGSGKTIFTWPDGQTTEGEKIGRASCRE